jgi:hypothetical protein
MTVSRALLVLAMLIAVGVAIVVIRGESARAANRVQRLHHENVRLEQELWEKELALAQLRNPEEIRRRAEAMQLDVVPPGARPE